MKRHEEFVEIAHGGNLDVLFLGDSLTDGWRTHGHEIWEHAFLSLRAANFGLAGDRTQQILWRIDHGELDGILPKVVVLLIGTNNTTPGLGLDSLTPRNTPQEIIAGITAAVEALQRKLPSAKSSSSEYFHAERNMTPCAPKSHASTRPFPDWRAHTRSTSSISSGFFSPDGSIPPEIMPELLASARCRIPTLGGPAGAASSSSSCTRREADSPARSTFDSGQFVNRSEYRSASFSVNRNRTGFRFYQIGARSVFSFQRRPPFARWRRRRLSRSMREQIPLPFWLQNFQLGSTLPIADAETFNSRFFPPTPGAWSAKFLSPLRTRVNPIWKPSSRSTLQRSPPRW